MRPKFYVGEDVILRSHRFKELDGLHCSVTSREWFNKGTFYRVEGQRLALTTGGFYYKVSGGPGVTGWWHESCLRKRPSDYTLDGLIKMLKAKEPA